MDIEERVNYYLGKGLQNDKKWNIDFDEDDQICYYKDDLNNIRKYKTVCPEQYSMYYINKSFTIDSHEKFYMDKVNKLNNDHPAKKNGKNIMKYDSDAYVKPAIDLFNSDKYFESKGFIIRPGDVFFNTDVPIVTKSRPVGNCNNVIINFDSIRHWKDLKIVEKNDIPFKDKNNKLIWRGAPNGIMVQELYSRPSRKTFVNKYQNSSNIMFDIGFAYIKPRISIEEQLKSKFLVSLEGGDVATGLKWMMYSNSVVLMPHPTMISWFMEDKLEPWVHYVPLEKEFDDLEEKYNWCLNNLDKCEEIANNGKKYVEQFLDEEKEKKITNMVLRKYVDNVNISLMQKK